MKYKIGDVSRILGISSDLLRYYEKKGIVSPVKSLENDYRYYEAWDINFLMDSLWYKSFGFPVDHVAEMINVQTAEEVARDFLSKEDEIREGIKRGQMLLKRAEEHRIDLEKTRGGLWQCRIEDSPEAVRYMHRYNYMYDYSPELQDLTQQWLRYMPFTYRCFEMLDDEDFRFGSSLSMEYAEALGVDIKPPLTHIPSSKSLYTVFSSSGKGNFTPHLLDRALEYAEKEGLELCGNAHGNLLCSVVADGGLTGFFEAWIPVKDN